MNINYARLDDNSDFETVAALVRKSYAIWDKYGFDYAARKYTADDIEKLYNEAHNLAAYSDGKLICVIFYYLGKEYKEFGTHNSAYSRVHACDPDYSGQGIGLSVLEKVLDIAKNEGCGEYIADTCSDNKRLLARYKKMGMKTLSYTSYPNTSYYSTVYMMPLNKTYSNLFFIKHRIIGYLKTHLFYNADGSLRPAAKILRIIKKI